MVKFLIYTTAGSLIWNTVLITIGNKVGANWESILGIFDQYSHIVLALLVVIFIVFVGVFYYKRIKGDEKKEK